MSFYRERIRGKTRIWLKWLALPVIAALAYKPIEFPGVVIIFLGASLRFWASGFLRKDSRPAVGGPYGHVRNPLYLGTYLMAVGTFAAIEQWPAFMIASIVFAAIYHFIILDEETKLKEIFGTPYLHYLKAVPRFMPSLKPATVMARESINPERAHWIYDWALSRKNKAYEAYAAAAGLVLLLVVSEKVWSIFT